jgi:hypothetical protein
MTDIAAFDRYVIGETNASPTERDKTYEIALRWLAENSEALHARLSPVVEPFGIVFGARYHAYGGGQYVDIAMVLPPTIEKSIQIRSVWRNEAALADLVSHVFPDAIRQYSARWLGSQRIDVFVPSENLAFEYQGEQHYRAIDFFGGEEAFRANQARDERKRSACAAAGVRLIEWPHGHRVDFDVLRRKCAEHGVRIVAPHED